MIVQRTESHLVFIRQPDHARLAGRLMAAWQEDGLPANPRRRAILTATGAHDDGWVEEDAAPAVDAEGGPVDFIAADLAVKQRVWPRVVETLAKNEPYAAALVAQHALTVYVDHRARPEWQAFFARMARQRTALLARCDDAAAAAIESEYRFVRMGDILSLIFCGGWRPPYDFEGRHIEQNGDLLTISPDPFAHQTLEVAVEVRRLPVQRYASDAELRSALTAAPIEWLRGTATGRG